MSLGGGTPGFAMKTHEQQVVPNGPSSSASFWPLVLKLYWIFPATWRLPWLGNSFGGKILRSLFSLEVLKPKNWIRQITLTFGGCPSNIFVGMSQSCWVGTLWPVTVGGSLTTASCDPSDPSDQPKEFGPVQTCFDWCMCCGAFRASLWIFKGKDSWHHSMLELGHFRSSREARMDFRCVDWMAQVCWFQVCNFCF